MTAMKAVAELIDPIHINREKTAREMLNLAVELDAILAETIVPAMRKGGHPLTGRVHSLRQEIKLRATLLGGAQ